MSAPPTTRPRWQHPIVLGSLLGTAMALVGMVDVVLSPVPGVFLVVGHFMFARPTVRGIHRSGIGYSARSARLLGVSYGVALFVVPITWTIALLVRHGIAGVPTSLGVLAVGALMCALIASFLQRVVRSEAPHQPDPHVVARLAGDVLD